MLILLLLSAGVAQPMPILSKDLIWSYAKIAAIPSLFSLGIGWMLGCLWQGKKKQLAPRGKGIHIKSPLLQEAEKKQTDPSLLEDIKTKRKENLSEMGKLRDAKGKVSNKVIDILRAHLPQATPNSPEVVINPTVPTYIISKDFIAIEPRQDGMNIRVNSKSCPKGVSLEII